MDPTDAGCRLSAIPLLPMGDGEQATPRTVTSHRDVFARHIVSTMGASSKP